MYCLSIGLYHLPQLLPSFEQPNVPPRWSTQPPLLDCLPLVRSSPQVRRQVQRKTYRDLDDESDSLQPTKKRVKKMEQKKTSTINFNDDIVDMDDIDGIDGINSIDGIGIGSGGSGEDV